MNGARDGGKSFMRANGDRRIWPWVLGVVLVLAVTAGGLWALVRYANDSAQRGLESTSQTSSAKEDKTREVTESDSKPQEDDPYIWIDNKGQEILRFERIASPVREVIREPYIRQPLLFRWICNKAWLKDILQKEHLCLYPFCTQEQYPCFSE